MGKGRILITGGAGFIGSHLSDRLLTSGYEVRLLDALLPQVHPEGVPPYLNPAAELRRGDVRDLDVVESALEGVDVVVHFAAAVGVGQSMYEVVHYASTNVLGTAALLEVLVKRRIRPRKVLVASSMSIYGEGEYTCPSCGRQDPPLRPTAQLVRRDWAMRCPGCNQKMQPCPTRESKPLRPTSVYAIGKRDQEEMVLVVCRGIGVPAVALRFFNVYGRRQALSNPYTGVAAIFSTALLNRRRPIVFEDGLQTRDFIHVRDVVEACRLAIEVDGVQDEVMNVGSGRQTTVLEFLDVLRRELSVREVEPEVLGSFREGDIRSCYGDVTRARERLGYAAQVGLVEGIREIVPWVLEQASVDRSREALAELQRHALVR